MLAYKFARSTHTTYYVRDAQGNVLGVYKYTNGVVFNSFGWEEQHLYGSSRLGILLPRLVIPSGQPLANAAYNASGDVTQQEGNRYYELTNHLGNVLATITDKKIGVPSASNSSLIDHYEAEVTSAQDYYPFGMLMPGRKWSSSSYRYGFNGQEKSTEIHDNSYTAEYWEYDSRIGRRWNVDPVTKPHESPYACFSNNPIYNIDPHGDSDTTYSQPGGGTVNLPGDASNITLSKGNESASGLTYKNVDKKQLDKIRVTDEMMKQMTPAGTLLGFSLDGNTYNAQFSYEGDAWTFEGYYNSSGKPYIYDEERGTVGKPGTGESMIPIWGAGRDAVYNFQKGNTWTGLGYSALAISDVFLVKSLFQGAAKGGLKALTLGNKEWSGFNGYRKFYVESGFAKPGEPLHHWLIHQNGSLGKYVPNGIKNQMWNLKSFSSQAEHMIFGHGKNYLGQPGANFMGQMWHGTPTWPKLFTLSYGGRGLGLTLGNK